MTLSAFVILQLAVFALAVTAVLGLRNWQLRRQLLLLCTHVERQVPAVSETSVQEATPPADEEPAAEQNESVVDPSETTPADDEPEEDTPADPDIAAEPEIAEDDSGLRALVTKFANENRDLVHRVEELEALLEQRAAEAEAGPVTDATDAEEAPAPRASSETG